MVKKKNKNGLSYRIEIRNNFVEKSETLKALVVDAVFAVKVCKIGHAGKEHPDLGVTLAVQIIVVSGRG